MDIILVLFILLYSAILHEIMHGFIAYRLGDPTAKLLGRLTLNPVKHLDIFYSLLLPLGLFLSHLPIIGGAKPVPVDPFNLRDGMKDFALVSVAGPLTNISLAIIASLIAHLVFPHMSFAELGTVNFFGVILYYVIQINLALGIFNLVPIPPLDGSKLVALLLPERIAASYLALGNGGLGLILIVVLFYMLGFGSLLYSLIYGAIRILGF
ncbi:MAG TPA: site-2 protease family protein [Candidatus Acidoferrales bacterium]|nr:site-2 protease family protein [Candidatus Acidoferrales bacterium]